MHKISNFLMTFFSVGVLGTLFAGALALIGYVVAMFIGGANATALCVFIYKTYFPWVIRICSICVGCGLIGMYMKKMRALSFTPDQDTEK